MRIALVTDGLYPDVIGGMQKHSFFLAQYLARNEVHVDLYFTAPKSEDRRALSNFSDTEQAFIHAVFVPFPNRGFLPGHYLKESLAYSNSIFRKFSERPPVDLIYAQGFTAWFFSDQHAKGRLKVPLAVNLHGLEMFQRAFGVKAKLEQLMLKGPAKFIIQNSDIVYSLGGKLTSILQKITESHDKIVEQSIGIGAEWVTNSIQPKNHGTRCRCVFVGRYEKRKGLDLLNEVMRLSDAEKVEFHLAGPIDKKHRVDKENVVYHGLIKYESAIRELLDDGHLLVCPSFAEGMPTVILEAMARGLAVIASDVGAVAELVNEQTGWLIEPGSQTELRGAIESAISESLEEKRNNARNLIAERYTWDRVIIATLRELNTRIPKANKDTLDAY